MFSVRVRTQSNKGLRNNKHGEMIKKKQKIISGRLCPVNRDKIITFVVKKKPKNSPSSSYRNQFIAIKDG